jgi:nitrogenase molybdenum-cofactor synthesis protein NifE
VLLITGGVKSWSVVAALQEAGMEIVGTSVKKSTKEDKERIKEIMGDEAHMIDDMTPREMYKMLKEARADIMLSGGRSQFVALKAKMPWLDINQERHHAYAGYEGMVSLVAEIDKALSNPVWAQVRAPAPWDSEHTLSTMPSCGTGRRLTAHHGHRQHLTRQRTVNPLKMSQPLGASYAFLGMNRCMPVMHGSQGCTSFGLVLLVRHFREAIPLQTTAMNEATTIMGGYDNVEKAILNIRNRAKPELIAICSTGLTETKGDDVHGLLEADPTAHPEVADTALVYVSTPDFLGAFQDGWAKAVTALIEALVEPATARRARQVNVLPGCHLTPGDIDELREIIEAFGLSPIFLPDVSGSLDGHMSDEFSPDDHGRHDARERAGWAPRQSRSPRRTDATLRAGARGPHRRAVQGIREPERPRRE